MHGIHVFIVPKLNWALTNCLFFWEYVNVIVDHSTSCEYNWHILIKPMMWSECCLLKNWPSETVTNVLSLHTGFVCIRHFSLFWIFYSQEMERVCAMSNMLLVFSDIIKFKCWLTSKKCLESSYAIFDWTLEYIIKIGKQIISFYCQDLLLLSSHMFNGIVPFLSRTIRLTFCLWLKVSWVKNGSPTNSFLITLFDDWRFKKIAIDSICRRSNKKKKYKKKMAQKKWCANIWQKLPPAVLTLSKANPRSNFSKESKNQCAEDVSVHKAYYWNPFRRILFMPNGDITYGKHTHKQWI